MAGAYSLLKSEPEPDPADRPRTRRIVLGALFLLATAAVSVLYAFPPYPRTLSDDAAHEPLKQCASGLPPPATPPAPLNLWASLTVQETVDISRWLNAPERNLNLTIAERVSLSDNVVFHIGAFRPPKAHALAYLADPHTNRAPERYARVTIHHGAAEEPVVKDYLVGPLPVSDKTSMRALTKIYHRDAVPFNARGVTGFAEINPILTEVMYSMAEATQELFGAVARGLANDTLVANMVGPLSFDGSFRRTWINWRRNVPGVYLHPVGFFLYLDMSGTEPREWKLLKIVYNHQVFGTVDEFMTAFRTGTLKRLPARPDSKDTEWTTRKRPDGPRRDLDHLPGPRSVSFAGLRFRIDRKTQYVSWMGWGMYLGFDRDMGLSFWDIRFRGERLIYELSPQEAIAQYAGNDPMQSTTAWLDRYFGMGSSVRDMLPGYDCPHEAVFLPATTHSFAGSITRERAVCVFEQDTGRPITRHTGYEKGEFGAVRGYVLVVRSISTVGKCFDYIFHLDGTIEVRLSASGYLQGGFWEPSQDRYGAPIRDTTMGSLHDHVINYKVDLDIVGEKNSLLFTSTVQEEVEQPWLEDDWGATVVQQKITRRFIESEDEALLAFPPNFQGGYAIVNREERNRWGVVRGYAIHPGYDPVRNTVVGSKRLLNNANWARYNLAVSRRKESEPSSSSMWNQNLPGAPMVDFHRFFDGENITQEDLVAWVNVGMHHLPQAEDSPNTRTNLAASSFFLTPLNYFDADVSMESKNAIVLSPPATLGDPWAFEDYGVEPVNCVPGEVPPFVYRGVRAFGLDGGVARPGSVDEMRKGAEMFHRIKLEL
ncbi:amine oxidase catalytic domain-containing protein [Laetiporus sulphureus 93-53]|uniref:Amine oxidase n=1 Tax=Laetiporus sulphureus 93-53 TaxID=1314785 RepID=A0A165B015_9APHY|nr:amine oxidase catalytic domain-containing protein [Laetiporus sulphureus 93-53]KZS99972.1 amine oxidase catalytic domain-containing protein [Laetiporus sulphureus 93-53]